MAIIIPTIFHPNPTISPPPPCTPAPPKEENLFYDVKISSVMPGKVTGPDVVHEPTSMELAMKLHYLRGVYYFRSKAGGGLPSVSAVAMRKPMFAWLDQFTAACGRLRRSESGRPYIKCNDCGVRLVEARCSKTLDEWLETKEDALEKLLVPSQVIGPELQFSPMVLLQLTTFKCGGVAVGLSWAHILGDAFSAVDFIKVWGQVVSAQHPAQPPKLAQPHIGPKYSVSPPAPSKDPLSLKRVGPVGDNWIGPNSCKMESFSFHLTATKLTQLQSKVCDQIPIFESISALIWRSVAKIRDGPEPKVVTIFKHDSSGGRRRNGILSNDQVVSTVRAEFSVTEANPRELADLIINRAVDERSEIGHAVERDPALSDFVVYGANLTFVDFSGPDFYGLEFMGQKPVSVNYTVGGIGEEGVVLVLPAGPKDAAKDGNGGMVVNLIMPEDQVMELKSELKREFSIG